MCLQSIILVYSMPLTSDCTGLKVNWGAWQASSLMCITDSLCDLDFYDASPGAVHEYYIC